VPTVLKSGSLNLLEPSGPVQGCTAIGVFKSFVQEFGVKFDTESTGL